MKMDKLGKDQEWNPRSLASTMRIIMYDHQVPHRDLMRLRSRVIEVAAKSTVSTQADVAIYYLDQIAQGHSVGNCLVMPAKTVLQKTPAAVAVYVKPQVPQSGDTDKLRDIFNTNRPQKLG